MKAKKVILAAFLIALSITILNALPSGANIHVESRAQRYDMRLSNSTRNLILQVPHYPPSEPPTITDPNRKSRFPTHQPTIIDPNMTFSLSPQEVSVKVGETFIIQTAISNATNMDAWQVYLLFDHSILQCINVTLPPDYVFLHAYTTCDLLMEYNRTQFTKPLQSISNNIGTALVGDLLFNYKGWVYEDGRLLKRPTPSQTPFTGSGNLCQLEFKAIASGSTKITLITDTSRTFQTYILDPDLRIITTSSNYGCNVSVQP